MSHSSRMISVLLLTGSFSVWSAPARANRFTEAFRTVIRLKPKPTQPVKAHEAHLVAARAPEMHVALPEVSRSSVRIALYDVESARFTPRFEALFAKSVADIKSLNAAGHADDAMDLATVALHAYMDHNRLELGYNPSAQRFFAVKYAIDAGLNDVLRWGR
jgi:hypothetical protein